MAQSFPWPVTDDELVLSNALDDVVAAHSEAGPLEEAWLREAAANLILFVAAFYAGSSKASASFGVVSSQIRRLTVSDNAFSNTAAGAGNGFGIEIRSSVDTGTVTGNDLTANQPPQVVVNGTNFTTSSAAHICHTACVCSRMTATLFQRMTQSCCIGSISRSDWIASGPCPVAA